MIDSKAYNTDIMTAEENICIIKVAWNERHGASNHCQGNCLFNRLFGLTTNNWSTALLFWQREFTPTGGPPHKWPVLRKMFACINHSLLFTSLTISSNVFSVFYVMFGQYFGHRMTNICRDDLLQYMYPNIKRPVSPIAIGKSILSRTLLWIW